MNRSTILRLLAVSIGSALVMTTSLLAQSYDEQARIILQLYEQGQKDSAYTLIEPLKRTARFVPSVIYTRAQMTPDDRALGLYKELVALDPGGPWADDALNQLIRRYADKRDSLAASTWMNTLRVNHPRSPFIPDADDLLRNTTGWMAFEPEPADRATTSQPRRETPKKTPPTSDARRTPTTTTTPSETYRASGMRGFALQVGLFPTRKAAEERAAELKKKSLRALPLPKTVDGKKQYALVIGPYKTIEDANKKKGTISTTCACPAFVVRVE
jgi:hypothetical protein